MADQTALFETYTDNYTQAIDRLSKEQFARLEEEADSLKSKAKWEISAIIAQYASAAAALTMGFLMGGVAGACLVASGAVGAGVRVAQDSGLTERILDKKQIAHLQMATLFMQLSLGAAGGILTWQANALAIHQTALESLQKASSLFDVVGGVANTTSHVGMKVYEQKIAELQAKLKEIELHKNYSLQTRTQVTSEQTQLLSTLLQESDKLRQFIQLETVS